MKPPINKRPYISWLVSIAAISLIVGSHFFNQNKKTRGGVYFTPPSPGLVHFSFGFKETIADSLWIRTIQDFDYCDQPVAAQECKGKSWLYQMLDVTTSLSPQFRMPYAAGALALSVLITDVDGATKIFDKGIQAFPKDWSMAYRGAYHYLYEVKDKKRAAELLQQAAKNGGPSWLPSLATRLFVDSGNTELAEALLQDMIRQKADPLLLERMRKKIEAIKKKSQ